MKLSLLFFVSVIAAIPASHSLHAPPPLARINQESRPPINRGPLPQPPTSNRGPLPQPPQTIKRGPLPQPPVNRGPLPQPPTSKLQGPRPQPGVRAPIRDVLTAPRPIHPAGSSAGLAHILSL